MFIYNPALADESDITKIFEEFHGLAAILPHLEFLPAFEHKHAKD